MGIHGDGVVGGGSALLVRMNIKREMPTPGPTPEIGDVSSGSLCNGWSADTLVAVEV